MNAMAPASAPPAPNAPEPAPKEAGGIFDKMGPVVIGLTAALYACGYTVVLTAAERLGISDHGSGIFKGPRDLIPLRNSQATLRDVRRGKLNRARL